MYLNDLPADASAFGRLHADLPAAALDLSAYPVTRALGPTPRAIRQHVGERTIGSFGRTLGTPPAAATLSATVRRLRQQNPAQRLQEVRHEVADGFDQSFRWLAGICLACIALWVGLPVAIAFLMGAL